LINGVKCGVNCLNGLVLSFFFVKRLCHLSTNMRWKRDDLIEFKKYNISYLCGGVFVPVRHTSKQQKLWHTELSSRHFSWMGSGGTGDVPQPIKAQLSLSLLDLPCPCIASLVQIADPGE
jgi:hypothetical protein